MNYKILEINQDQKWIAIEVDFGDGSPKYNKRMMADTSTEEGIHNSIGQWLADYLSQRVVEDRVNLSEIKNKSFDIDEAKLPKTSLEKAREEEARKAKELADQI